ncbi:hypothetical protein DRQ26_01390, partial [bacterium]
MGKNILEVGVGSLINKLHLNKRRDVLFFGDIFVNYIKMCEIFGYKEEMKIIGQKWMNISLKNLLFGKIKKLPTSFLLNNIMKKIWINLGLMDNFHMNKRGDIIDIKTENEAITKTIGSNYFSLGLLIGVLNVIFDSHVEIIKSIQRHSFSEYTFMIENK